ncbi:hypothetical protein DMUE_1453 [Dictyocoela muelleri]|nr:hypothetical protein DMUE_1453 [Dictyocoela muelleri]
MINVPIRRNTPASIEERLSYALWFQQLRNNLMDREIVFLDECGFQVSMRRKKGRSLIGNTSSRTVQAIRTRNISVVAVMTRENFLDFKISTRPYNSESMCGFINEFGERLSELNLENCQLIMDNASIHKTSNILDKCSEKNINIKFLLPYSPFLYPIENLFSKWKNIVRGYNPNNEDELFNAINSAASQITPEDCNGFFRHMLEYIQRCLDGEIIND